MKNTLSRFFLLLLSLALFLPATSAEESLPYLRQTWLNDSHGNAVLTKESLQEIWLTKEFASFDLRSGKLKEYPFVIFPVKPGSLVESMETYNASALDPETLIRYRYYLDEKKNFSHWSEGKEKGKTGGGTEFLYDLADGSLHFFFPVKVSDKALVVCVQLKLPEAMRTPESMGEIENIVEAEKNRLGEAVRVENHPWPYHSGTFAGVKKLGDKYDNILITWDFTPMTVTLPSGEAKEAPFYLTELDSDLFVNGSYAVEGECGVYVQLKLERPSNSYMESLKKKDKAPYFAVTAGGEKYDVYPTEYNEDGTVNYFYISRSAGFNGRILLFFVSGSLGIGWNGKEGMTEFVEALDQRLTVTSESADPYVEGSSR